MRSTPHKEPHHDDSVERLHLPVLLRFPVHLRLPAAGAAVHYLPVRPGLPLRRTLPLRRGLPLRGSGAMNAAQDRGRACHRRAVLLAGAMVAALGLTACSHAMMLVGAGTKRPAASEFGFGPRTSAQGRYVATLVPERELRPRQMHTVRVTIADGSGVALDGATLTIGGGMPQHGHGLPTRPRVARTLGDGTYEIAGVRFNMGGWWELKFRIAGAPADSIVFNLAL